jgi:TonB family protein
MVKECQDTADKRLFTVSALATVRGTALREGRLAAALDAFRLGRDAAERMIAEADNLLASRDPVAAGSTASVEPRATADTSKVATSNPTQSPPSEPRLPVRKSPRLGSDFPNAEDYYPAASRRLGEEGTVAVRACLKANGELAATPTVVESSGSARLDEGAINLARAGRYIPGTDDGESVASCLTFRIRFQTTKAIDIPVEASLPAASTGSSLSAGESQAGAADRQHQSQAANSLVKQGDKFRDGDGVAKDYRKAMLLEREAAEQEDAIAQLRVGTLYEFGWGVSRDPQQGISWMRKAAGQGLEMAQLNLAATYQKGFFGVPQDLAEARFWYKKAIDQGSTKAQARLAELDASSPAPAVASSTVATGGSSAPTYGAPGASSVSSSAPTCWSSELDAINDPVVRARLGRNFVQQVIQIAQGPNGAAALDQQIAQMQPMQQQAVEGIRAANDSIAALAQGAPPTVNPRICATMRQSGQGSALMAAMCQRLTMQNMLHFANGSVEVMQCVRGSPSSPRIDIPPAERPADTWQPSNSLDPQAPPVPTPNDSAPVQDSCDGMGPHSERCH